MTTKHEVMRRSWAGFTLMELLLSLALGLALVSGVALVFLQGNRSAVQDGEFTRLLENGRWALRHLGRELAMAGFWGRLMDIERAGRHASVTVGRDCGGSGEDWVMTWTPLQFLDNADSSRVKAAFGCLPHTRIVEGSDIIAIKRTAGAPIADAAVAQGRIYLRSDGGEGLFFQSDGGAPPSLGGASPGGESGGEDGGDGGDSDGGAANWAYQPQIYYLRDYTGETGDGVPCLSRAYLHDVTKKKPAPYMDNECLVPGIENLQLEFGIDMDGDAVADCYSGSPSPAELTEAVTARLQVTARSVREVPGHEGGHYRRAFSTIVLLRNRPRPLLPLTADEHE